MNKTHPSRWKILHKSDEKFCQVLVLPLGPGTRSIEISTKLFNIVYREWDGSAKTNLAGDFATALRELRNAETDLASIPQVNAVSANMMYRWLDEFELVMGQWRIQMKNGMREKLLKEHKSQLSHTPKSSRTADYGTVMHIAIAEYIKMAGPMGDAKQIIEKAKAVADAYEETKNAESQ